MTDTSQPDIRLLGPVEMYAVDGSEVDLGPPKRRSVFAALALAPNRVLDTDELIERVWDIPPRHARTALHGHISALRRVLDDPVCLASRASGYELQTSPHTVDASTFGWLTARAYHLPDDEAMPVLEQALALWHGRALAGAACSLFLDAAAVRLTDCRLEAVEALASRLLDGNRPAEAAALVETYLSDHPLREELAVLAMRALRERGRRSTAVGVYRRTEQALQTGLGVTPSDDLRREHAAVVAPPVRPPAHVRRIPA